MARTSQLLALMLATGATSCLVTSEPDFSPRERTRPEIITTGLKSPSPNPAELVRFWKESTSEFDPKQFTVWVISEDVGEDLRSVLLIDYGYEGGVSNGPYRAYEPGPSIPAASASDGPRRVEIGWEPGSHDDGCHTITLLVTHRFTNTHGTYWCPADPGDAATLTWVASVCKDSSVGEDCPQDGCPYDESNTTTYCEGVSP